jgi:hypothetical protein
VFVDGVARGMTPARLSLPAGSHILELRGRGVPRVIPLQVPAGGQISQYLEFADTPMTGLLVVHSQPAGAKVTVDNKPAGLTPVTVLDLTPGTHTVFVIAHDGSQATERVQVSEGATATLRLSLEKLPDRFMEHPASVIVITNLYYAEAPWLRPRDVQMAAALNWKEVALEGSSSYEYGEQLRSIDSFLVDGWQVKASEKTGNPVYVRPSVLVIYRKDHSFLLDNVIPKPGQVGGNYDLVVASQPWRARMSAEFKAKKVLGPLVRALGPAGRLLAVQSCGDDPALEMVNEVWPEEKPFKVNRHELIKALREELGREARDFNFVSGSDAKSIFRYEMHTLPSEVQQSIGTSTLFAAWNAASYVAQIEDERIENAMRDGDQYLQGTAKILKKHKGLWFNDESFVVSRKQ